MAKKTTTAAKSHKTPGKRAAEAAKPHVENAPPGSAAPARSHSKSKSTWAWEALAGIIGEKCFSADDFTHTEVGRWWFDIMAPSDKYRWKAGSAERSAATPDDARDAILGALANQN